mmetsp:Transcript_28884/g.93133  ORF Transcript_28884/g.93133 Transcript_28884/m.93133 type:complete len:194 (+) Transcript_28884:39-620(+)
MLAGCDRRRGCSRPVLSILLLGSAYLFLIHGALALEEHGERGQPSSYEPAARKGEEQPKGEVQRASKWKIRKYLEDRGIKMKDLPLAFVVYESLSLLSLVAMLSSTYLLQPLKRSVNWGDSSMGMFKSRFEDALNAAERRLGWMSRILRLDAVRLATAYAECTVLRLILKPVLVPAKLYLTFTILRRRVNRER